jgi:hypothetical protein
MSETKNLITFIDHIGRTILAEEVSLDKNHLTVKNPAIIHVQPTQQGQLNVQTIPLYFREFLGPNSQKEGTSWKFNVANIVQGVDIDNDPRLVEQYHRLFSATPNITIPEPRDPKEKVIKLFDE